MCHTPLCGTWNSVSSHSWAI